MLMGIGSALGTATGIFNTISAAAGWLTGRSNLLSQFKSAWTGKTDLNTYAGNVEQGRENVYRQSIAPNSLNYMNEQYKQAIDPMNSTIGKSMARQATAQTNQQLQSSLISGGVNPYDAMGLQQRTAQSITSNLTSQLSPLSQAAANRIPNLDSYYSGANPAISRNIYSGGSDASTIGGYK